MKVFKFGGASVRDAAGVENLGRIVRTLTEPLFVVVSAMGKTTNALEKVALEAFEGNSQEAVRLFGEVLQYHNAITDELGMDTPEQIYGFIGELAELLERGAAGVPWDEFYDRVVSFGELFSTAIVAEYIDAGWLDMRRIFITDISFRGAEVDYERSKQLLRNAVGDQQLVVGQGFIGGTEDGRSTTLGREGSDYSAALVAAMLRAESMTVWKDVAGIFDSDPKQNPEARILSELSYADTAKLLACGAQILHPKTIRPLSDNSIPLYVKCFFDPKADGSVIK